MFDDDPHPINLLVSAIKIPNGEAHPLRVYVETRNSFNPSAKINILTEIYFRKLPNPFLSSDSDICLIVKDLEKGWKVDHEPTTQHYQELLESKEIDFISEV